jgi:predicted amidophosphoribosyltransferase
MSRVRVGMRTALKELLLPALCVACDAVLTGADRGLCGGCRSRLLPMTEPCCPVCGCPSDSEVDPCLACVASPPPQTATVLWGCYEGALRRSILALKHGGHDELARPLAHRLAARIGMAPWVDEITAVVEIPTHDLIRLRRGPSAASLLASECAKTMGRPHTRILRRHSLVRQAGRTRAQRIRLPRGSFSTRTRPTGESLLLIDDVCTTGTTFRRAAETLIDAGAAAVYCAAVGHAPDPRRL